MQSQVPYQVRQTIQTWNEVEKEIIMKTRFAILLHFPSHKDRGGWQQPLLFPQHFTLPWWSFFHQNSIQQPRIYCIPSPAMGLLPFLLSKISQRVPASTTLAPNPSHILHHTCQLPTCSCLSYLFSLLTPGLVRSRWNSSCHIPSVSLLSFVSALLCPSTRRAYLSSSPKASKTFFFQPL